jgi:hypothetical protein
MTSRWFNVALALFWASTMTWLFVHKILPTLRLGDPPTLPRIVERAQSQPSPVGWQMFWDDRPIGAAVNWIVRKDEGPLEMHSTVQIDDLPLSEVAPAWLGPLGRAMDLDAVLKLTAHSVFFVAPPGRLAGFYATLDLHDAPDVLTIRGTVHGDALQVDVRSGDAHYQTSAFLSADALVGHALAPQDWLPGLRLGQTWTTPIYSPFRPAQSPLEILHATVERQDVVFFDGEPVVALLVAYRADPGDGPSTADPVRGRVWVRPDGMVLKQQALVLSSRLTFVRLPHPPSAPSEGAPLPPPPHDPPTPAAAP